MDGLILSRVWRHAGLILSVLCASFLVAVSGSRIGALTLLLGLLIIIPNQWQRFKQRKKIALLAVTALVMGIGLGSVVGNSHAIDKTVAMQSGYSGESRIGIYTIALDLIKQQPVFGYGVGSFGRVWQNAKPDFFESHPNAVLPNQYASHPHNEILLWLVEGGVTAGFGLFIVEAGVVMMLKQLSWPRASAYMSMLLPIGLHTQVELPFYVSALHWFLFIILIFILSSYKVINKTKVMSASMLKLSNIVVVVLGLMFMVFFLHSLRSQQDFLDYSRAKNLESPFKYAFKNPYFSDQAQWIDMNTILNSVILNESKSDTEQKINSKRLVGNYCIWAEQRLSLKPNIELYTQLAKAYFYLGDGDGFCSTIKNGLQMYPTDKNLQQGSRRCEY